VIKAIILALLVSSAQAADLTEQSAAVPVGTWFKPVTVNTVRSVDPGPGSWNANLGFRGLFEAWNGGAWMASRGACGSIAFWGGGHQDYFGNQIVELDVCGNGGPTWKRTTEPYKVAAGESYYPRVPCGAFPNNSPGVPHTYGGLAAAGNSLVTITAASNMVEAVGAPQYAACAWAYDFAAGVWRGPWTHGGAKYGSAAYDSLRGLVWFESSSDMPGVFSSLDPVTGVVTAYNKSTSTLQHRLDAMAGYDPIADRVVTISMRSGIHVISERDPGNPSVQGVTAAMVNKPTNGIYGANSMAWSPTRKAWIVWFGITPATSQAVYEVKRSVTNGVLTYTWSLLTDPANTLVPATANTTGIYGKMQVATLPDGTELLIGLLRLADGVVAFKLSGPTVAPPPPPPPSDPCMPPEYIGLPVCPVVGDACDGDGVFVCERFDTLHKGKVYPGTATPVIADGVLNMTIPALSGADPAGHVRWQVPSIGEGQTIAFSYRVKADKPAIALNIPGRKHFILWRGASSCTDLELSMTHEAGGSRVVPYTNCGARDFYLPLGRYNWRLQYPDFNCTYQDRSQCARSIADTWQTYYIEIGVGHYGQPDSHVVMWQRNQGEKWKRFVERSDYTFSGSGGFNQFMLTAYITRKDATKANPVATVQFDDLIMSTQSIDKALL
jgi:hypothetical protein